MIRQDRFLLLILGGILVVVALALGVFFARQGGPVYGPEDTPQGVLQNYIIALSRGELERAFQYVAGPPGTQVADGDKFPGLPDWPGFRQFFLTEVSGQLANTGLQIGQVVFQEADTITLSVTVLHTSGTLFDSVGREIQQVQLVRQEGAWKITRAPYPFWSYAWQPTR